MEIQRRRRSSQTHPGPVCLACGRPFIKHIRSAVRRKPQSCIQFLYALDATLNVKRVHASRVEAVGHMARWPSHLFRHVAGSVPSPLHMMEDRKIQRRLGGEVLRERFSPVAHSRLWVSPPSSCDFYSLGSMQWQASGPITTHPGRKGRGSRRQAGRQRKLYRLIAESEPAY